MLSVVFFGMGGDFSRLPFEAVASRHRVRAVVSKPEGALARLARERDIPCWPASRGHVDVVERIASARPDIVCISSYPWIVPKPVFEAPRLGAVNLHASLLPLHRGVLPLYWVYHDDDRTTGVTVHSIGDEVDAGDVILQRTFPLPRGYPVESLDRDYARLGAGALADALDMMEAGTAPRIAQDSTKATFAPMIERTCKMMRFDQWDVERVWHCLAGLFPHFCEALSDDEGRDISYEGVIGYERSAHDERPGSVALEGGQYLLYCLGGFVRLRA